MRVSDLLAAAGAVFILSAGAAFAAEGCECCKDMTAGTEMKCCDEMKAEPTPNEPAPPAPVPADDPVSHSLAEQH